MLGQSTETYKIKCDQLYKQRLYQLKKYVLDMFLNLEKNEVLKQLRGSPALEEIRICKIQQIIREALEGQKQQYIQLLVEKNTDLVTQLEVRCEKQVLHSNRKMRDQIERLKNEQEENIHRLQSQHERELDGLENQFKQLLRQTLSNYEQYLLQKMESQHKIEQQSLIDFYTMQITQLNSEFNERIFQSQKNMQNYKKTFEQREVDSVIPFKRELEQLKRINESIIAQNRTQSQKIIELEVVSKGQEIEIQDLAQLIHKYSQHQSDLDSFKKSIPEITFQSELEIFKLKEEFQDLLFRERKNHEHEMLKLKKQVEMLKAEYLSEIQHLKKVVQQYSRDSSTTQSSPPIKKIGRIGSNKGRFKSMQNDFQSGLFQMRDAIKRNPILRKVSVFQDL